MNPVCPYCRTEIGSGEGERVDCPSCMTPHHADCFAENGGCTVFGCAQAPVDEPKINVSGLDLAPPAPPRPAASNGASVLGLGLRAPQPVAPGETPPPAPRAAIPPPPRPDGQPGAPVAAFPPVAPAPTPVPVSLANYYPEARPKNRVVFILLGIFLGLLGAHNFYAGYAKRGAMQLALTLLSFFYGAVISWLWAIVEVCLISDDADGVRMVL